MSNTIKPQDSWSVELDLQNLFNLWWTWEVEQLTWDTRNRTFTTLEKLWWLSQEEIDVLERWFYDTVEWMKIDILEVLKTKIPDEELRIKWLEDRTCKYIEWVIREVEWHETDYSAWNIVLWREYDRPRKFWDFPWEHSIVKFFYDTLADARELPEILDNLEESRPILAEQISSLKKQIFELSKAKLWSLEWWIWWFKHKEEMFDSFLEQKYWEDKRRYYSWHAFAGSTPRKDWVHIYKDFNWEDSIILFMENCIKELEQMPTYVKTEEDNATISEELSCSIRHLSQEEQEELLGLYEEIQIKFSILTRTSKEKLWKSGWIYWWTANKCTKYFIDIEAKYKNCAEFYSRNFMIWWTPWEWWQQYKDFPWDDSVIKFLDSSLQELIYMSEDEVEKYQKKNIKI